MKIQFCVTRTTSCTVHALFPAQWLCFAGCGNGKYLSVNPSVFKIGADRCCTLTETAREKEHEVHSTRGRPCSSVYTYSQSFHVSKSNPSPSEVNTCCFTQYVLTILSILGLQQLTPYTD